MASQSQALPDYAQPQDPSAVNTTATQSHASVQSLKDRIAAFKLDPEGTQQDASHIEAYNDAPRELSLQEQSLPIVIPQTAGKMNAFNSPFVRCYAESLRYKGIDKDTFVAFLDGLNECFIGNPAIQGVSIAGAVLQQFYGMSTVQYAGAGVQAAAGLASAAVSYGRTRAYIKALNVDLFHPAGLSATILKAKKMTQKIGFPTEKMSVTVDLDAAPTKQETKDGTENNSSFLNRMQSLDGYVAGLTLDVPESEQPTNLLKRMGAAQSNRSSKKQSKRSDKKLAKAKSRADKVERKVDKEERKMEREIEKLEREGMSDKTVRKMEEVVRKGEAKIEKVEAKRDKRLDKIEKTESKSANKMRWIVITPWVGEDDSEDSNVEEEKAELSSDEETKH